MSEKCLAHLLEDGNLLVLPFILILVLLFLFIINYTKFETHNGKTGIVTQGTLKIGTERRFVLSYGYNI